mmetsp:Transcript_22057/g.48078  ORF Transcript_22057/g.48078 Transcript_22057/m.48078 type:complete len:240 (-) Transcript_22057:378-1097(-)
MTAIRRPASRRPASPMWRRRLARCRTASGVRRAAVAICHARRRRGELRKPSFPTGLLLLLCCGAALFPRRAGLQERLLVLARELLAVRRLLCALLHPRDEILRIGVARVLDLRVVVGQQDVDVGLFVDHLFCGDSFGTALRAGVRRLDRIRKSPAIVVEIEPVGGGIGLRHRRRCGAVCHSAAPRLRLGCRGLILVLGDESSDDVEAPGTARLQKEPRCLGRVVRDDCAEGSLQRTALR